VLGLRRRLSRHGDTVVDDPPPSASDLFGEIDRLAVAERGQSGLDADRRLLRLRHLAAIRSIEEATGEAEYAAPVFDRLPPADPLPEVPADALSAGLLRAGILRDGCLLVRGLLGRPAALHLADEIDRAFAERDLSDCGEPFAEAFFEEFESEPAYAGNLAWGRVYIKACCGLSASDSPQVSFDVAETYRKAGISRLIGDYLGETALMSVEKTTLRKAVPSVPGAWHQDGSFMGDARAVNMWLALSRCGDEAPGIDVVPRRLDHFVETRTDEAIVDAHVSQRMVEQAAGGVPMVRPIFEPGDALFFDGMLLHQTGSDPSMPRVRFGIESWFFGASSFPENFTPIAI
jgi:hypothetical protein